MQLLKNSFEKNNFVLIGKIVKTHGIAGKLVVALNHGNFQFKKLGSIMLEINGLLVPFFISHNSLDIYDDSFILKLDNILSDMDAKKLIGYKVFVEKKSLKRSNEMNISGLTGFTVIDTTHGTIGNLTDIEDIPGNPIIIIHNNECEILIPANGIEIIEINEQKKEITIKTPEGLISLFR